MQPSLLMSVCMVWLAAVATTTTTTASSAVAAAAAATATRFAGPGFVDREGTTAMLLAVQRIDRCLRFRVR